jgi:hypothetical protein
VNRRIDSILVVLDLRTPAKLQTDSLSSNVVLMPEVRLIVTDKSRFGAFIPSLVRERNLNQRSLSTVRLLFLSDFVAEILVT